MARPRGPVTTTLRMNGPFFRKDPARTFRQNIRVMVAAIAAEAQKDMQAQMRASNSQRAPIRLLGDHVSEHIVGRPYSYAKTPWAVTMVVGPYNFGFTKAQGTSLMAAAARVETRTHAVRKTKNRVGRMKKANIAELMKGIA